MAKSIRRSSSSSSSSSNISSGPRILSLAEWEVDVTAEVRNHLANSFRGLYEDESLTPSHSSSSSLSSSHQQHVSRILHAMKAPPATTICRLNSCRPDRKEKAQVIRELHQQLRDWIQERYPTASNEEENDGSLILLPEATADGIVVTAHAVLDDVLCVEILNEENQQQLQTSGKKRSSSLFHCRVPPPDERDGHYDGEDSDVAQQRHPQHNEWRQAAGWPLHHKVVITDRLCGEAILRGADVFVRGVQCADANIVTGDVVAVYADLESIASSTSSARRRRLSRGLMLQQYHNHQRTAVFVGVGVAACARATMFHSAHGLAVAMRQTAGPRLPPMNSILSHGSSSSSDFILQNLPSIVVAHILLLQHPWPVNSDNNIVLLDMCAAPGGKTSHLASLLHKQQQQQNSQSAITTTTRFTIVACDKSRHKMVQARQLFQRLGCDHCITSLALDTTRCVVLSGEGEPMQTVAEILAAADPSPKDGLLNVKGFYPQSFDHILLDPPCSALGLRPKLSILPQTVADLESFCAYQRQFIANAVVLLKPGGTMTYSTCTIHALENEGMVRHILDAYPSMKLIPIHIDLGHPGLPGMGLNASECEFVRRFDPSDIEADTIGFFVAKFKKAK